MTTQVTTPHIATLVPDNRREMFLPALFGVRHLIFAENTVYTFMDRLSPRDYGGGFWNFYECDGHAAVHGAAINVALPDRERHYTISGRGVGGGRGRHRHTLHVLAPLVPV